MECDVPEAGFLNVINYGDGDRAASLLLPNRIQTGAAVPAGHVRIPGTRAWNIVNDLPRGMPRQRVVFVVLFSKVPINLQEFSAPAGTFADLDAAGFRSFRSARAVPAYRAVKLEYMLTR